MLKTKVKVSQVINLSEARYCAGMGVDFLSFPIAIVDPKTYNEITGWVAGPEFGIEIEKENLKRIDNYECAFIQTTSALIDSLPVNKKLILTVDSATWNDEKFKITSAKDRILFIELSEASISILDEVAKEFEVLIRVSGAFDLDLLLKSRASGISLEGSAEDKAGLKEYPLAEVLEKLEE